ncbi:GAF domain-containing protein [Haloarchaeobius sp. HRN-SO-5]|uniref:GAF domain-containing protein n=1 Tax=Haloarchaeobius sp. HRN-SO-5 TaxID=3446118 RepID=UPI003EB6A5EA
MTTATPTPEDVLERVDALGPPGTPVTTPEVAEGFDCTQRTIYNRLDSLVDDTDVRTKKVGANSRVWWRPVDGDDRRNGGASDRRDPVLLRDGQAPSVPADSDMAERIREFEWAETPIGPMDEWPIELQVAVEVMLGARKPVGIYWGEDLTLLYNDPARDVIGEKHPDALGQPAREVFAEAWDTLGPVSEQVMAGDGAVRSNEFLLPLERTDEIEDIWWESSYSPIPLADGSIGGVFNIAIDVTDRVRAEQDLRETNERLQVALNAAGMGTWEWDLDARTVRGDDIMLSLFELPPTDEAVPVERFLEKESTAGVAQAEDAMDTPFEPGEEIQNEFRLEHADTNRWISWRGRASEDDPSVLRGVSYDVTERKQVELERNQAMDALRESKEKYHSLFEEMDEGFALCELVRDADGQVYDIRYVELNEAFEDLTGVSRADAEGRLAGDVFPGQEDSFFETYERVAETGESEQVENYVPANDRWYDVRMFPRGGDLVAVLYEDITDRKERERERQKQAKLDAFRIELTDAVRPLTDPVDIQHEAARVVGEHLDVDRAHYGEVLADGITNVVHADYYRNDVPSVVGEYQLSDFGDVLPEKLRAGETMAIDDVATMPGLSDDERAGYIDHEVRAWLSAPLVKEGKLVGYFTVTQSTPREWTEAEIRMVEETAQRTWAAVERARTEQELRESEERYHRLFDAINESINEGFCVLEVLFDQDGDDEGYRYVETNPAYEEITGLQDVVGKRLRDVIQDFEPRFSDVYGAVLETGEPARFEARGEPITDGWYDISVVPYGEPDSRMVAVLVDDITERKAAEQKLQQQAELDAFRVDLTDAIRPLSDPTDIQREAVRVLGEELDVDRAHYGEVLEDGNTNRIHADFCREGIDSMVGEHHFEDYGEFIADTFQAGETLVLDDCSTTPELSDEERAAHRQMDIAAYTSVPLVKEGHLTAYCGVTQATPREWTDTEVAMVEETAERTWAAVERAQAQRERRKSEERYRTLFESIDEGFCIVEVLFDEDDAPVDYRFLETNPAFEDRTGLTDAEGERMRDLESNHEEHWFEMYGRIAQTGAAERFQNEAKYLGDRWYDVYAFRIGDPEERKVAMLLNDVSELKDTQQSLERLTVATQELIEADPETVHDRVAELTVDVLDVEYAALWRYDEASGELTEATSALDAGIDTDAVRHPDDASEHVWQAFIGDEITVTDDLPVDETASDAATLRSRLLIPLGRHGVVCIGSLQSNAFDERIVDLAETLGATLETAWDRADSERRLQAKNEELQRLDRLNTLIREIDQALVAANTREEVDEAVCERLASSDLYEFAWIGEHDPGTDRIEPRAWAGVDSGYLDDLAITVEDTPTNQDPIARAVRTGELQLVADIATDSDSAPWREATLERGAWSLVCIPLVYDDAAYGVLAVYADHPQSDEDERNQDVLSELGNTIAHTLNARETRATLQTDSVVELTLRFRDADTPLYRLARETGCAIEHQGFVPRSNGQADVFFIARGISPEDLQATAERLLAFDDLDYLTEEADGSLVRARVSDPTLAARVTDEGSVVRSITIDAGVATVVLGVPHSAAVREFLDRLRQWNQDVELRARQSRERPLKTRQTFAAALEDRLTDRQREVLQTAYLSGFFEMPRVSNGQEVTELLGVSQPTFSEHLRAAERTLCELLFENE